MRLTCTRARRRLGLDRNPLRRSSDRIEAGLLCGMILAFGALAPLSSAKAGQWVMASGAREVRAELSKSAATVPTEQDQVPIYRAGGYVHVPRGPRISISSPGTVAALPLTMTQVRMRARVAMVVAPIALAWVLALAFWITRRVLDRRRMASWELAWSVIGPQWSRRR